MGNDRSLVQALDELLKLYDATYAAGIDKAIDETCGEHCWRVRELVREEDARLAKTWPAMLGRSPWEIESGFGQSSVLVRLRRALKRLRRDQRKEDKQTKAGTSAHSYT